jgi:pimeloyl-ACP methyl ester carboxylesterase
MTVKRYWRLMTMVVAGTALTVSAAHAQLLDTTTRVVTSAAGRAFDVTTGFVRVPELRAGDGAPSGTVDLAVVRVRIAGAAARPVAHVILAGGPGDSGVDLVTGLVRQGDAELWDLFDGDVIGIDQRGTGQSRPNLATRALYDLPLDTPGSLREWLPRIERIAREVATTFRAQGIRLEAYNTRESADDVADVRRALGYQRLTVWGRSYGSHLALAIVGRHPDMVHRLVLVSPEGPNHTWKRPSHVDAVIRDLVKRGATELDTHIRQVLARLSAQPVTVSTRNPLTGTDVTIALGAFDVQWITTEALGDSRLVATLPAVFREMAGGDFTRMAQIAVVRRSRAGVQSAMKHMMDLSSGASSERRRQIDGEAREALLGHAINFPSMYVADAWAPVTDLGESFRQNPRSSVPTLILVGDLDPRTPVENAREIAATLPAAQIVILENATHQFDMFGAAAIRSRLGRFLRGEAITEERLVMPAIVFQ